MTQEIQTLKDRAETARLLYCCGDLTREAAKESIAPYLEAVNAKAKELAKKYGQAYRPVTFINFCR